MSKYHHGLTLEEIVETALKIADTDGLEKVTMRAVANALGVTPMAIYHHVPNKEELVDQMADHAIQTLPGINPTAPWDTELERFFVAFHKLFVAHPAVAQVMSQRPLEGPTATRIGDQVLEHLINSGFEDHTAVATFVNLVNYTVGASLYQLSRQRPAPNRLARLDPKSTPTASRLREHLTNAAGPHQFRAGLATLIRAHQPPNQQPDKARAGRP